MTKKFAALATAAITLFSASAGFAQDNMMGKDKMMHGKGMMHGKMMHGKMMGMKGKMVGYCAECKMYYSASDTKKMHMMDPMGHKMMMMPMSKMPKGTKMGKMSGGMMMHDKMGGMKKPM